MTATASAIDVLTPSGYHLLIRVRPVEEKKNGIYVPADSRKAEEIASPVGQVVALGPMAYGDMEKFPNGPWCAEGDWILMRPYAGTRIKVDGEEYRLINDDTVEAVIADPDRVERVA